MNRPLSAEAEEELEWQVASRRRKAWAKCRSSWQASETEDLSTETTTQDEDEDDEEDLPGAKLPAAAGRGRCGGQGRAIGEAACSVQPGAGTGRPRPLNVLVTRALAPACAPGCRLAPLGRAPGLLSEAAGGPGLVLLQGSVRMVQPPECFCMGYLTSCPFALFRRKRAQREDHDMAQRLPVSKAGVTLGEARGSTSSLGPVAALS